MEKVFQDIMQAVDENVSSLSQVDYLETLQMIRDEIASRIEVVEMEIEDNQ